MTILEVLRELWPGHRRGLGLRVRWTGPGVVRPLRLVADRPNWKRSWPPRRPRWRGNRHRSMGPQPPQSWNPRSAIRYLGVVIP